MATRHHRQDITYWALTGKSEFSGFTFSIPAVLKGRWEEKAELIRNPVGEEVVSRAIVYLGTDVAEGDYLALDDQSSTLDPTVLPRAFRVIMFQKTSDLRNLKMIRKAYL